MSPELGNISFCKTECSFKYAEQRRLFYTERRAGEIRNRKPKADWLFQSTFLVKLKADKTSLSCWLKLALMSHSPDVCLVTWNFSMNDSILVWSVEPSAGAQ